MFRIIKLTLQKKASKSAHPESTNVLSQDTVSWLGKVAEDLFQILN